MYNVVFVIKVRTEAIFCCRTILNAVYGKQSLPKAMLTNLVHNHFTSNMTTKDVDSPHKKQNGFCSAPTVKCDVTKDWFSP